MFCGSSTTIKVQGFLAVGFAQVHRISAHYFCNFSALAGLSSQHCVCLTDGYLNPAEFRAALAKLRVPVPLAALTALAGSADLSRGRPLSYDQCLQFIDVQRDSLLSVFHQFDVGRDGSITENDLKLARASLGLKISDDDIKQLIRKVDKNHSGAVVRGVELLP